MYCTIDYGDRAVRSPPRDEDAPFRIALLPCDVLALLRLRLEAPPSFFAPLELLLWERPRCVSVSPVRAVGMRADVGVCERACAYLLFSLVVGRLLLSRSLCRLWRIKSNAAAILVSRLGARLRGARN